MRFESRLRVSSPAFRRPARRRKGAPLAVGDEELRAAFAKLLRLAGK